LPNSAMNRRDAACRVSAREKNARAPDFGWRISVNEFNRDFATVKVGRGLALSLLAITAHQDVTFLTDRMSPFVLA